MRRQCKTVLIRDVQILTSGRYYQHAPVNPLRYFLVILRSVFIEGANAQVLWPQLWPMLLIGLACLSTAAVLFRRRMY